MIPCKEVRAALGLRKIGERSREIYRWQVQGQTGCKFKAEEIVGWQDGGLVYMCHLATCFSGHRVTRFWPWGQSRRLIYRDWWTIQSLLGPSLLSLPSWLLQSTLPRANSPQEARFLGEQQCLTELQDCTSVQACHGSLLSSQMHANGRSAAQAPSYITGCSGLKQMSVFVPIPELLWLRGGKPREMASFRRPGLFIAMPTAVTFPRFFLEDWESMFSLEIPGNTMNQTSQVLPVFVLPKALLLAWPRSVSAHPHPSACQHLPMPVSCTEITLYKVF